MAKRVSSVCDCDCVCVCLLVDRGLHQLYFGICTVPFLRMCTVFVLHFPTLK